MYARGLSLVLPEDYCPPIMAKSNDAPKNIGELIDQIDRIREELLVIQHSMEKMEASPPTEPHESEIKVDH